MRTYSTVWIGESAPYRARLTSLLDYEDAMQDSKVTVKVLRPQYYTEDRGRRAQDWWLAHVNGTVYDFAAYPRLAIKALIGDLWSKPAGWEWANWCTEGVANAWREGANLDVWHKTNPTPFTTGKRLEAGELVDVTAECVKVYHPGLTTFYSFDLDALKPGYILHVRSDGFWARMIRKMLKYESNHDAIFVVRDITKVSHKDDI